jgi:hypothetical protein
LAAGWIAERCDFSKHRFLEREEFGMGKLRVMWGQMKGKNTELREGAKFNFGFGPMLDKFEAANKKLKADIKELDTLLEKESATPLRKLIEHNPSKEKELRAKSAASVKKIDAVRTKVEQGTKIQTGILNQLSTIAQKYVEKAQQLNNKQAEKDILEVWQAVQSLRSYADSSEKIVSTWQMGTAKIRVDEYYAHNRKVLDNLEQKQKKTEEMG